jgi:hypothetical protein
MAFDVVTTPAVGAPTKVSDYVRLRDALRAAAAALAGVPLWQGGDLERFITDTTEVDLPAAFGAPGVEIDGTYLGYVSVYLEVVAIRHPDAAGTVTCTVDLFNVTDAGQVAGSPVAISLSTTAATYQKGTAITLPASAKRYRARIKTSDGSRAVAAVVRVVAKGS